MKTAAPLAGPVVRVQSAPGRDGGVAAGPWAACAICCAADLWATPYTRARAGAHRMLAVGLGTRLRARGTPRGDHSDRRRTGRRRTGSGRRLGSLGGHVAYRQAVGAHAAT